MRKTIRSPLRYRQSLNCMCSTVLCLPDTSCTLSCFPASFAFKMSCMRCSPSVSWGVGEAEELNRDVMGDTGKQRETSCRAGLEELAIARANMFATSAGDWRETVRWRWIGQNPISHAEARPSRQNRGEDGGGPTTQQSAPMPSTVRANPMWLIVTRASRALSQRGDYLV